MQLNVGMTPITPKSLFFNIGMTESIHLNSSDGKIFQSPLRSELACDDQEPNKRLQKAEDLCENLCLGRFVFSRSIPDDDFF